MERTCLSHSKITALGILGTLELGPIWGPTAMMGMGINIHTILLGMGLEILGKQVDFLLAA